MSRERPSLPEFGLSLILLGSLFFFGASYPWVSMSLCALIFLLVFISPLSGEAFSWIPRLARFSALLLFLWVGLQSFIWSLVPYESQRIFVLWLAFGAAFLTVQQFSKRGVFFLLIVMALAGGAETLYSAVTELMGSEAVLWQAKKAYQGYWTGTFINRNHLAGFLELAVGIQAGLLGSALASREKLKSLGWAVLFILCLAGLFKTGSRGGVLSLTAGFVFTAFVFFRKTGNRNAGYLIFLFLASTVLFFLSGIKIWERLLDPEIRFSSWNFERIYLWKDTLRLFWDYPFQGIGLGSFEWIFPAYQSGNLIWKYSHAHQDYLELLVSLGIPGFVLLTVLFFTFGLRFLKKVRLLSRRPSYFIYFGGTAGLFSFLIHGFADFNLAIPANALSFLLLFSALLRCQREEGNG